MKKIYAIVLAAALLMPQAGIAADSDPTTLGTFGDWSAYTFTDGGEKVCFMSAKPSTAKGDYTKRGDVMLFVTHWPDAKTKNIVSVSMGYPHKKGTDAVLKASGKSFPMQTDGETVWSKEENDDDVITAAIRTGAQLVVEGVSSRGTKTTDTYDLKGSADALEAITKACAS